MHSSKRSPKQSPKQSPKRTIQIAFAIFCLALLAAAPASARTTKKSGHKATKTSVKSGKHGKGKVRRVARGAWKRHGQQGIKEDRTRAIQSALIRERYLDGDVNGVWDTRTQAAMQRFQSDNGWQSKVLPDARALIKLGLGPDHTGLLNPETAAIPTISTTAGKSSAGTGNIQQ